MFWKNGFGRHVWDIDPRLIPSGLKVRLVGGEQYMRFADRVVANFIDQVQQIFYVAEILYVLVMTLVKVSILLFYVSLLTAAQCYLRISNTLAPCTCNCTYSVQLRVFPGVWFRIADFIVLATVIASGISFIIVIIFQCNPISQSSSSVAK